MDNDFGDCHLFFSELFKDEPLKSKWNPDTLALSIKMGTMGAERIKYSKRSCYNKKQIDQTKNDTAFENRYCTYDLITIITDSHESHFKKIKPVSYF
jgi:hypothetical protein